MLFRLSRRQLIAIFVQCNSIYQYFLKVCLVLRSHIDFKADNMKLTTQWNMKFQILVHSFVCYLWIINDQFSIQKFIPNNLLENEDLSSHERYIYRPNDEWWKINTNWRYVILLTRFFQKSVVSKSNKTRNFICENYSNYYRKENNC